MTSKWLRFEVLDGPSGRKTDVLGVYAVKTGIQLGVIAWYTPFRKYVFWPLPGTLFDADCLAVLENKLNEMMAARGK